MSRLGSHSSLPLSFTRHSSRSRRLSSRLLLGLLLTLFIPMLGVGSVSALARHSTATQDGPSWLPATPTYWPLVVKENPTTPQIVTNGVTLSTNLFETVGGPEEASMLNVDLSNPNLRLGVVQADDHLFSPDETVSSMANRTGAVAGINGDFFEIHGTGDPLGMVEINGQIEQSPNSNTVVLGVTPSGSLTISPESFSGSVSDGSASHTLNSVNRYGDVKGGDLALFTPELGSAISINGDTVAFLQPVTGSTTTFTVQSVQTGVTTLPALSGQDALVGSSAAATWLTSTLHVGDTINVAEQISPDSNLVQAVGGGALLVQNGVIVDTPSNSNGQGGGENDQLNPITGLGVSKDGKHAFVVVFDGHQSGPTQSRGLTRPQMAGFLLAHGAYQAMMFDSGGSSEMVARLPGQHTVSVINTPSDGQERQVGNGLFFYSTEAAPGPATSVVVNNGQPLTLQANTTTPLSAYALDAEDNPAADPVQLTVDPPHLASIANGEITTGSRGSGELRAWAGGARVNEHVTVIDKLGKLTVTPSAPDLLNNQTQQLQVSATAPDGVTVPIPLDAVQWSINPSSLGTIDANGLFTASASAVEVGTVTATIGGVSASSSVAVGQVVKLIAPMTDLDNWGVSNQYMDVYPRAVPSPGPHTVSTGSISLSTTVKYLPGDSGSMDIHYNFPAGQHVYHLDPFPNDFNSLQIPLLNGNQAPEAVGLWVKGDPNLPAGANFAPGVDTYSIGFYQADNSPIDFHPGTISGDGWTFISAQLPPSGLDYPLRLNYVSNVVINPPTNESGDVYFSDLEALYSPRPVTNETYQPLPQNPSWLQFEQNPANFSQGGTTVASLDDAHVHADDPNATGSVLLQDLGTQFQQLPSQAQPSMMQTQGDMSDTGSVANLQYLKSLLDGVGVPYHEAVGNHEITQGTTNENGNFTSVFGPTHYTYTVGEARFIVTDSSHIGVLASDPYQVPDEQQYQWLVAQLDANTSPVVFITTHVPAYDPHVVKNSQFADRYEAQMYELLAELYQNSHPGVHVVLLFGHARGFAENILDQYGNNADTSAGLPNFVVADLGVPAYAPVDQGGFYNYVLFHVLPDGTVQFAVMPVLASVSVSSPSTTVAVGQKVQLTAVGTSPNGDDLSPLQLPIADPASHFWTSSDPSIASVDPDTGEVTVHGAGSVTISCTTDMLTGSITLTATA